MTIGADLVSRYSSEVDVDWWEALILSHSRFSQTYYITGGVDASQGIVDGVTRDFQPIPFDVSLPQRDAQGRGDLQVQIGAVGQELNAELEAAIAVPTEPILARYTVYIEGDLTPQYDPMLALQMTDITLTETQVVGVAQPTDTINAPFPRIIYRIDSFPGLDRR